MSCGFNIFCQLQAFIAPFWFWIQVAFWCVTGLLALYGLSKLKEIGGWPAVTAAVAAGAYAFGFLRGHKGKSWNPVETSLDPADAAPVVKRPPGKRRYNPDTNRFE